MTTAIITDGEYFHKGSVLWARAKVVCDEGTVDELVLNTGIAFFNSATRECLGYQSRIDVSKQNHKIVQDPRFKRAYDICSTLD